jgi:hypothetical protein
MRPILTHLLRTTAVGLLLTVSSIYTFALEKMVHEQTLSIAKQS